jgi:stage V sporulation protein AB
MILATILLMMLGLAGGFAVGSSFVALIMVLDLVPRLVKIARAPKAVHAMELALVSGVLFFTLIHFYHWELHFTNWLSGGVSLLQGIFVGMLAASLIEVLNVIPIITRRIRMQGYLTILLVAVVLGKISGSLFDWLVFHSK